MRCEGARCLKRPLWSRALSAAFLLACLTLAILPSDVSAQYAALSQPRAQMAAAAAPTVALFAAGNNVGVGRVNTVDVYDAAADTWTTADLTNAVYEGAGAATSTKVIFAGGSVGSGAVLRGADIYDVSSGTWSYQASALSAGRVLLAAAGTPSRAFFAGGNGAAMYALVDIYDSVANAWSNSSMPGGPRSLLAAVALDDVVVFAGGTYPFWSPLATVDVYDLTTSGWRNVTALSAPRYALAATAVAGRFALFGGGCGTAGGAPGEGGGVTVVDMYDSISGLWTVYPNGLSVARHSLAAASVGNLAVFAGGSTSSGPVDTVDVFDLSTRTWTWGGVGALSVPRGLLSAVSVGGALLFAGGCTSWTTGPAYANVDRFTIANGTNDAQPSTITTLTNAATTVTASTASTSTSLIASTARAAASASSTATAFSTSTSLVASLTAADASTAAASTSFAASATDATSTASAAAAAALGTTTSAMASETTTGATSASPAPPAVVVVRVEGFLEVNGTWTATPGQVTIFSGNVSNTGPARIVVSGEATLAGTAVLELGSVITDTQRVRLVLATSVTGTFEAVRVRGPPGDCTRYTAHATVLPTLFAVDVQSTQRRCAPGTDRGIIILAAVIGGVFGLAIALTALIGWMDIYRPYLLPRWLARVRRLEPGDLMWR